MDFASNSQHPPCVIEGFVREDMMREYEHLPEGKPFEAGTVFLRGGVAPVVGAYVKVQVSCEPTWNEEFEEEVTYGLMGGHVHTVREDGSVLATVEITNMPAPEALEGVEWDVELVLDEEYANPWVVRSMRPRMAN